ncbi:MAG: sulfatase [Armatimonadetes bacterium]|nr:sulfatase [Armatimonadota bacterium]
MYSTQPNLIVIFADQMRGMDMGCAGNHQVISPNLDRLAAEGVRFTHAVANTPVCTPSRGCLLTGLYPLSHRAIANDLPVNPDAPSIAKVLRAAGYKTGYVGKWHLDGGPRDRFTPPGPRRLGFDDYWAAFNCNHQYFDASYFRDAPIPIPITGYEPVIQTDLAIEFLQQKDERPFCLFLSWGPPHDPYDLVPSEYKSLYDPAKIELRPNADPTTPGPTDLSRGQDPKVALANYYAAITALDDQLGRLLAILDESDLAESTVVVFTSDHGDMLWSHGMMKKQQPWEEAISVPLLIRWPARIPAGIVNASLIGTVDVTPSLIGMLGIAVSSEMQGADLSTVMLGDLDAGPDSAFLMDMVAVDEGYVQGLKEWRGVRTAQYTYARWRDGKVWLLYDNVADPFQMTNLAGDPAYNDLERELESVLMRWLQITGDPFLSGEGMIRSLGLTDLWNARELSLHARHPRLIT